jgi:hypothetical protein
VDAKQVCVIILGVRIGIVVDVGRMGFGLVGGGWVVALGERTLFSFLLGGFFFF